MHDLDLTVENISKTEGHSGLDVKVRSGKVEDVHFRITENKRFYTQAIRGKNYMAAPQLMSRICGTCSLAHLFCCIEAIEKALAVQVTEQTRILRTLAYHGLMIRDHALHLYLFCLPDVLGKDSVLEFDEKNPVEKQLLEDTFAVKSAGNNLAKIIAGRSVHAPFPAVGGFARLPDPKNFPPVLQELQGARERVLRLLEIYAQCEFDFSRETQFVALSNDRYDFLEGKIRTSAGETIPEERFSEHLEHVVLPYSQASGYQFEGKEYMVGALARMNLNQKSLCRETRQDCAPYLPVFPSNNVYHNNLAQGIETLHCIDQSLLLLQSLEPKPEGRPVIQLKESKGTGVIEAPRGTLYYQVELDATGVVKNADIVVPTGQNQINIEKDIAHLVEEHLDRPKEQIRFELEKLIRAYDPCMSCASHFLRINWT